jgi:hypothetical protein
MQGARVAVAQVLSKDQVIATFLERSLGDVVIPNFVGLASLLEALCEIGGN